MSDREIMTRREIIGIIKNTFDDTTITDDELKDYAMEIWGVPSDIKCLGDGIFSIYINYN